MIEKIQFSGITRRPSDLASKEGACEESLNVMLDVGEVAPILEPEDRTAELVGGTSAVSTNITDRYIYIHKTGSYTNYIALSETVNQIVAYINGVRSGILLDMYASGETYESITSIGNTLVISTDKNLHYILYKDGEYHYLGTHIPEPRVNFQALPTSSGVKSTDVSTSSLQDNLSGGVGFVLSVVIGIGTYEGQARVINTLALNYDSGGYIEEGGSSTDISAKEAIDMLSEFIWAQYNKMKRQNISANVFSLPVFARSAVKLYDGSYIYQSVPYLLHTGSDSTFTVNINGNDGLTFSLKNVYEAKVSISYPDLSGWEDIVRSVDVFVSTDICNPKVNKRIDGAIIDANDTVFFRFLDQSGISEFDDVKEEILSKTNFYLAQSTEIDDIGAGTSFTIKPSMQDELLVKETLLDDNLSHHKIHSSGGISSYNSRLVLQGLVTNLYSGHPYLQSTWYKQSGGGGSTMVYSFVYKIRTEDGGSYSVFGRDVAGNTLFSIPAETIEGMTYIGIPYGFLYYPDPRCYRCDIYYGASSAPSYLYSVPMKEHPGLNGSYALGSLASPVTSLADEQAAGSAYPSIEDSTFLEDNKLVMSEALNPFSMLLANRLTFTDALLAVATTTKALSTGQFGQFPLYVFTKGGIWAVPITGTGALSDPVPVSRDVVLSSESVTPIDQAIVFVTEKGVMLLSGSDVTELSPEMDGRHYAIEDEAADLLPDTEWEKYLAILQDTTPFISFMRKARAVYDYANRRLVFFTGETAITQSYQYIYKMDSLSWHKMSLIQTGFGSANILNGYPDALVCFRNASGVYIIGDLSVRYDAGSDPVQGTLSQVIITRPYNFNLPHVAKTIKKMFLRGIIQKGNLKYILLGSPDGINYHVIRSLRGPSNNVFFRAILLGTLTATERLTYLEMDYEPRFTNKPR